MAPTQELAKEIIERLNVHNTTGLPMSDLIASILPILTAREKEVAEKAWDAAIDCCYNGADESIPGKTELSKKYKITTP